MKYSDIMKHDQPWYGVKSVHFDKDNDVYEERIIVLKASSTHEALKNGRAEAEEYAEQTDVEFSGYIETFHFFDLVIEDKTEVYSTMRSSSLNTKEYIKRYIATGDEIVEDVA